MNTTITFNKLPENRRIVVRHAYEQPVQTLWDAYTKTEILEQWWAPKPYKAVVLENNFEEGGRMHYYMLSPEGEKHYCLAEFFTIDPVQSFKVLDAFCDEEQVISDDLPRMAWHNVFTTEDNLTVVTNTLAFEREEDMVQILAMGFEEGYTTALNQLYDLLNK